MAPAFLIFLLFQVIPMSIFTPTSTQAQRNRHPHFSYHPMWRSLAWIVRAPLSMLNLEGKIVMFKLSNRTGGPRLGATIRIISPSSAKKDAAFLLSTLNAENCASNCNNILTTTSSRCNIPILYISLLTMTFIESFIILALYIPPTTCATQNLYVKDSLICLSLFMKGVALCASFDIRLVCSSQNGLLTFSECSKTAQPHNIYDYQYPVARRELFLSHNMEELQKWLRYFNWCVTFRIEALVRSLAIDIAEALELMPDVNRIVEEKGKEVAASMLGEFYSKTKHMLWNLDEEVNLCECFRKLGMR